LLLVELNEFSVDLLEQGAREMRLPAIARLLAMRRGETSTRDRVEHHGLDPWVQWVSVHTGQDSAAHGVLHLGDTPSKLGFTQVWERLSERGVSSGIWGAMNATRGNAERCLFFLPDPWTFSEPAYPPPLDDLLALPRYYARNYLEPEWARMSATALRLCRYALGSGALLRLLACLPLALRGVLRNGVDNAIAFSLFDLVSTVLFQARRRRDAPQFSLIFLNSIAHLQHHRWRGGERLGSDLRFGLRVIDHVLHILFEGRTDGEALVVANALTQEKVSGGRPLVAYRQLSPERFVAAVGLDATRVEALMTSDAHVFLRTPAERERAIALLEAVQLDGKPLFQVERDPDDGTKLFYQVVLWDPLPGDAQFEVGDRSIAFFEHFEILCIRTGSHVPRGQVYAEGVSLPRSMANHELAGMLLRYFEPAGESK
jgi:hypothetical protein